MKTFRPIVLIGMMGSGKSSIGKLLAQKLNLDFVDTDIEIEKKFNLSVKEIFEDYGENKFREIEYEIFKIFSNNNNVLVASGGGSFCQKNIYEIIKKNFLSVWLDVNEEIIFNRLKRNQNKRPLIRGLNENDLKEKITHFMLERNDCYNKANLRVKLANQKINESFQKTYSKIMEKINSLEILI